VATFNAGTVLERLDYDFSALAGPPNNIRELAEAKGTIREPTSLQVQAYLQASAREMQRLRREARAAVADAETADAAGEAAEPGPDATDAQLAALASADAKKGDATRRREAAMFSKLCSGDPSTEILLLLPHRIMAAFVEWLMKEVMDPEAVTGAGSPPLAIVRSPAAG
jgi:hypothetical protein